MKRPAATFDDYAKRFPKTTQQRLKALRAIITRIAPDAVETISYGMPTYARDRVRLHFAAYARHIGFYPGAAPLKSFAKELADYETAKGSVKLPLDAPLPTALLGRMVKLRFDGDASTSRRARGAA